MNFDNLQKGVSIYIAVLVITIILGAVLALSAILISEIRIIKGMSESVVSFFAADSGIEKTFYYDRKIIPKREITEIVGGKEVKRIETGARGLCNILKPGVCPDCQNLQRVSGSDCDPFRCTDCQINFSTKFGSKKYEIQASVSPENETTIKSVGFFKGIKRAIQITYIIIFSL